ncbi:unnamed protein product [Brassica rapa]|uniref:Uncharacterized protein n=1 Tax=Brassica campestris TaxID=3711 RepID=A0A3P6C6N0_BRACM|nr:unnamed protein product [Brassica rapa]VDD04142.1 unnamed protein product [Brassica rapa]
MISNQSSYFSSFVTLYYFFFFLVALVLHTFASPMLHYCRHDQRDALLDFKHEFPVNESNSVPSLNSWNKSSDCCDWENVKCDAKSGNVISLYFINISLNNSLKPNSGLFKLQHLRNLTLRDCHLYGVIPSSLGNLSHLTHLDLRENDLVGEVPISIGNLAQLEYLNLDNNQLSGYIPLSFSNFTKLSYFHISNNQFTGECPLVLLSLATSLSVLDISENLFKSTLPSDMSGFHNLKYFHVFRNSLFGSVPRSLGIYRIQEYIIILYASDSKPWPKQIRWSYSQFHYKISQS